MAEKKISDLPAAGAITGAELLEVVQGGVNKKTTPSALPVSTAQQAALDAKAPLSSPALTGTPTATTAGAGNDSTRIATTAFVQQEIAGLGGGSGEVVEFDVTQTAHGFSVGHIITRNSGSWAQADRDSADTVADAIVSAVADANNFTAATFGKVTLTTGEWDARTGDSGGLTDGEYYWLSSTAGGLTKTQPATGVAQCLGVAISTTVLIFTVGEAAGSSADQSGSAFPSSPSSGQRYFRTDLGLACYYDGTRWLTVEEYSFHWSQSFVNPEATTNRYPHLTFPRQDYGLYLTKWQGGFYVTAPNSGSAYWTVKLNYFNTAGAGETTIDSFNTSAATAANYIPNSRNINAVLSTDAKGIFIKLEKTSTPGSIYYVPDVFYRLIVT